MAVSGGGNADAVIRLRLDTTQAKTELDRFLSGMHGTATIAGRATGEATGGFLSSILRSGPGGLAVAGLGAEFAAPIVGDLHRVASGILGTFGHLASESMGLGSLARHAGIPRAAQEATAGAAAGMLGASQEQILQYYALQRGMMKVQADARDRVMKATGGQVGQDEWEFVKASFVKIIELLIAIKVATMLAGGVKAILKATPGIGQATAASDVLLEGAR